MIVRISVIVNLIELRFNLQPLDGGRLVHDSQRADYNQGATSNHFSLFFWIVTMRMVQEWSYPLGTHLTVEWIKCNVVGVRKKVRTDASAHLTAVDGTERLRDGRWRRLWNVNALSCLAALLPVPCMSAPRRPITGRPQSRRPMAVRAPRCVLFKACRSRFGRRVWQLYIHFVCVLCGACIDVNSITLRYAAFN